MLQNVARRVCALAVIGLLGAVVPAVGDEAPAKIGSTIAPLQFKDIRYVVRSLDDLPNKAVYVLVFVTNDCPVAQKYMPALKRLDEEFRDRGVQFLAINAGAADSVMDMAEQAIRFECEFPFVKDFGAAAAQALGVTRTPQVVVLDAKRVLRYRGRIDDQYRVGGTQPAATRADLREAIEAVVAGREVTVSETPVDGCVITRAKTRSPVEKVTYADHVAPLVRKHCVACHRPGAVAPFALTSYDAVASRAEMIAEVVDEQRMPPWYGSTSHDQFANRRSLTPDERAIVGHWVATGKERGDESKLPALELPPAEEKWRIGKPDVIITETKPHDLAAEGVIPYQYAILPYMFARDTWVRSVQILPDNPSVVHHCNLAYVIPTEGFKAANFITGVVPGGDPFLLDDGVAYRIPQNATLILQIHFVTTGKPENCQISVGIKYAGGVVQKRLQHLRLDNGRFEIPPGAAAHPVRDSRTLDCNAIGVGLFSHMHLRGKDMTFIAHKPDGTHETMLVIPNYSFDWQHPYRWAPNTKRLPKGTEVECLAHYDNSAFNPYNPDPTATVKEGPQTFHEMMNGFFFYTDADEQLNLDVDPATGGIRSAPKATAGE
jgi:mono/diheme cytochrome c family protein